jgi:transcriptional regulator with XRE-family HTH domain
MIARQTFATNLRRTRLKLGYSQEKLAEITNLHRTYIGSVERGERNVTIDVMEKIGNALGIPLTDLLDEGYLNEETRR